MHIDTAQFRPVQYRLWQDQPVSHHHHELGFFQLRQIERLQLFRLKYRDAVIQRPLFDRTHDDLFSPACAAVRLGKYGRHVVAGVDQGL